MVDIQARVGARQREEGGQIFTPGQKLAIQVEYRLVLWQLDGKGVVRNSSHDVGEAMSVVSFVEAISHLKMT